MCAVGSGVRASCPGLRPLGESRTPTGVANLPREPDTRVANPTRGPRRGVGRTGQKTRMATSAGAASNRSISSSSLTRVNDAPAMSRDVQYSPT